MREHYYKCTQYMIILILLILILLIVILLIVIIYMYACVCVCGIRVTSGTDVPRERRARGSSLSERREALPLGVLCTGATAMRMGVPWNSTTTWLHNTSFGVKSSQKVTRSRIRSVDS